MYLQAVSIREKVKQFLKGLKLSWNVQGSVQILLQELYKFQGQKAWYSGRKHKGGFYCEKEYSHVAVNNR